MVTRMEDPGWRMAGALPAARAVLHPLFSILVFSPLLTIAGCSWGGALAHKFVGPPPIPAQYKPAKEPMLVLVENYRNPSASMLDANRLAMVLREELRRNDVAPVVSANRLDEAQSDPAYAKMSIPAVGRATGAKQVLYVHVGRLGVEETVGGEMIKGSADMTVRIVDAATGDSRWPIDPAGHPVAIETPWLRRQEGADEASLREQMSRRAADYIVKLFRKHSVEEETMDQAVE